MMTSTSILSGRYAPSLNINLTSSRLRQGRSGRLVCRADKGAPVDQKLGSDRVQGVPMPQDRPAEDKDTTVWPLSDPAKGGSVLGGEVPVPNEIRMFNEINEAINGRSAMIGFLAAVIGEITTHESVYSQLAGKPGTGIFDAPFSYSIKAFALVFLTIAVATLVPRFRNGERPSSRTFGPFTPQAEYWIGRVAMLGFFGLIGTELLLGNRPFFG